MRKLLRLAIYWSVLSPVIGYTQIQSQRSDHELEASDLKWQKVQANKFEPIRSNAFKKWANSWEPDRDHFFSKIDVTGHGKPEYIVSNTDFPSGGRPFLILQKRGNSWVNIADFQGGLVLSGHDVKKGYAIHAYGKAGKFNFLEFKYNGYRYVLTHEHTIPEIVGGDGYFKFNAINFQGVQ